MSLRRRLDALEAKRTATSSRIVSTEALQALADPELDAFEEAMEAAVQSGVESFESLYAVVGERSRRALEAYSWAIEAVRRGGKLPTVAQGERCLVSLLERIESGDEEARREWESRDGYRIWKYHENSEKGKSSVGR
jgi:hypothetical protein